MTQRNKDLNNLLSFMIIEKSIEHKNLTFRNPEFMLVSKTLNSTWNYTTFALGDGIHVGTGCSSEDCGNKLRDLSAPAVLHFAGKEKKIPFPFSPLGILKNFPGNLSDFTDVIRTNKYDIKRKKKLRVYMSIYSTAN